MDKMMGILSAQDLFIIVLSLAVVCYLTPVSRVTQVLARHLASACGALWKALLSGNTPLQHRLYKPEVRKARLEAAVAKGLPIPKSVAD